MVMRVVRMVGIQIRRIETRMVTVTVTTVKGLEEENETGYDLAGGKGKVRIAGWNSNETEEKDDDDIADDASPLCSEAVTAAHDLFYLASWLQYLLSYKYHAAIVRCRSIETDTEFRKTNVRRELGFQRK